MTNSNNDRQALDYVLGWTSGLNRWWLSCRLPSNPQLKAKVEQWQATLRPLDDMAQPEQPPPELWTGILGRLNKQKSSADFIRMAGLTASGLAVAGLAAFLLLRPVTPLYVAELRSDAGPAVGVAIDRAGMVKVTQGTLPVVAADKSLELWMIPPGGAPQLLGVITGSTSKLPKPMPMGLDDRITMAISIEPLGGSSTGLPTGPVVVSGALKPV
jgi:anti-sigma-K factor RskA